MAGLLAGVTVVLHFAALLYIGLGGFLAWRWPKSIFVHVFFAVWGVAINTLPLNCPLTEVENYFRSLQGLGPLPGGFNEYYIYGHVIPRPLLPARRGRRGHTAGRVLRRRLRAVAPQPRRPCPPCDDRTHRVGVRRARRRRPVAG